MTGGLIVLFILAIVIMVVIARTAVVVPQQSAYVVERLGRYHGTISAGFHVLFPFVDTIRYRHSLKEIAVDIPAQVCITRDNVQVGVDGVLYLKVLNPERASYGITDYMFAISQLAQTTLRSEVGKIDLDRTFEERTNINTSVVSELDKASESWGVKVLRYEIKNITPPHDILAAMEKQMRAEREKRAVILTSEGTRDAAINTADGVKQEVIKASEARRQQQINEAEGESAAILAVASATAEGIRRVADAIKMNGGYEAVQLRVAEQYITQFGELAKKGNTIVLPANVADVGSMIALAMKVVGRETPSPPGPVVTPTIQADGMPDFDAIVVGSGFGGAVLSCRLAAEGQRVLVLERGRRWNPGNFPRAPEDPWLWDHRNPVARHGWFDFRVFPNMSVVQGAGVGGGSLVYANISVDAKPDTFEQRVRRRRSLRDARARTTTKVGAMLDVQTGPGRTVAASARG